MTREFRRSLLVFQASNQVAQHVHDDRFVLGLAAWERAFGGIAQDAGARTPKHLADVVLVFVVFHENGFKVIDGLVRAFSERG